MTENDNNATERESEIAERCEKATGGRWKYVGNFTDEMGYGEYVESLLGEDYSGDTVARCEKEDDAEFIAHAREDVPYLLEQNRTLRKVLAELVALMDDERSCCVAPLPHHTPDCPWLVAKRLLALGGD